MKRIVPIALALIVLAACGAPAASPTADAQPSSAAYEAGFEYEAGPGDTAYTFSAGNFSLEIPEHLSSVVAVGSGIPHFYEDGPAWTLYYTPPQYEGFGTQICSIVEVPRAEFFDSEWFYSSSMSTVQVVAADSERLFVIVGPIGGVEIGRDEWDEYSALSKAMDGQFFATHLTPDNPDGVPRLTSLAMLTSAEELDALGDKTFTWAEAAIWAFDLISAQNKGRSYPLNHSAYAGTDATKAIAYLDSYGMLYGYDEESISPESPFTRADFVQLLQRMQFARGRIFTYPNWLGDPVEAEDLDETHWAYDAVNCAFQDGWLEVEDGRIRPDDPVTAAEMARALRAAHIVYTAQ